MRDGEDVQLREGHTLFAVYREMLSQVCRDFATLPPVRTLTMAEIRFFYDIVRPELRRATR